MSGYKTGVKGRVHTGKVAHLVLPVRNHILTADGKYAGQRK